jgi:hypothetical protein
LRRTRLSNDDALLLAQGIGENSGLTQLDLSHNHILEAGLLALLKVAAQHPRLRHLYFARVGLTRDVAPSVARLLSSSSTLLTLDLSWGLLGERGALKVAKGLIGGLCCLTSLNLRNNDIGQEGASAIAQALRGNSSLRFNSSLPYASSANNIGPLSFMAFVQRHLDLSFNGIGDAGAIQVARVRALLVF